MRTQKLAVANATESDEDVEMMEAVLQKAIGDIHDKDVLCVEQHPKPEVNETNDELLVQVC